MGKRKTPKNLEKKNTPGKDRDSDHIDSDDTPENGEPSTGENGEEENGAVEAASMQTTDSNSRLRTMMDRNFIEYASYVIKDRAIPDVDDGLKPVQRRILWSLFEKDDGTFHKVANIIGETMKYHPHGDASIGDALVNLANREAYIDKQGNFGNIMTGSPAAAPRYIECRLTPLAREVLFNRDITELIDSYDSRNLEPVRLPSKLPTLLLMGVDGIAVGTNTKIMPHNFKELLEAQISILKDEPFTLYPDFLQGGIMDVSKYEDGLGKLVVRAKVEIDGRNLSVKEVPPVTNTAKLMDSIEAAVNRNKIKIASFKDYTAEHVDIQLTPLRGYDPVKAKKALYAYTDCQMSISCNPMVIMDNRPVRMSISSILRRNTEKLVQYLKWELQIEAGKCLERILARTLAQIFIEEGIYKRIEKCKTKDAMFKEVRTGLEKFKSEWLPIVQQLHENIANGPQIMPIEKSAAERLEQLARGIIPDSEIDRLVEIPIRRISAFEIDKNREEIELYQKTLDTANKNLKKMKVFTIKYLQGLIDKYGHLFPRRTEIKLDGFEKIDMKVIALNNIRVGWDKKNCYIGTNVKSEDIVLCNEFDHLLCVERTGEYKIIDIPEKIFIDRLYEFRKYDKTMVFGIVYSEKKTGRAYYKRTSIGSFIKDKEYRLIPDGCKLELITPRPNALYEIKVDTPIRAKQTQTINLMNAPVRSPKAGGSPVSPRKILKISFLNYLDGTEENEGEPSLLDASQTHPVETAVAEAEVEIETEIEIIEEVIEIEEEIVVIEKKASGKKKREVQETKTSKPVKETPKVSKSTSGKKTEEKPGKAPAKKVEEKPEKVSAKKDSKPSPEPPRKKAEAPPKSEKNPKKKSQDEEDDESWGIQQPDLGF